MKSSLLLGLGKNTNHSLLLVTDAMHERTRAAKSPEDLLAIFPTGYSQCSAVPVLYRTPYAMHRTPYATVPVRTAVVSTLRSMLTPYGTGRLWMALGWKWSSVFCMPNKGKRNVTLKVRPQFGSMITSAALPTSA